MYTWLIAGAVVIAAPALKEERKPERPPEGPWALTRAERDGVAMGPAELGPGYTWRYTPTECVMEYRGERALAEKATYTTAGDHRAIDFQADDEPRVKRAIWKLDGDTLTVCEAAPGEDRPTEFTAPKGSKRRLWVLQRVKD